MTKKLILMGLLAFGCIITNITAQVTIGKEKTPEKFSVLELISNEKQGLRMPQMTTKQRDAMTESDEFKKNKTDLASGLTIYNKSTNCFEYWNGVRWVSMRLGAANITLFCPDGTPFDLANAKPAKHEGGWPTGQCTVYTPKDDNSDCALVNGQKYNVHLTAGVTYTTLTVDPLTSAFSLTFDKSTSSEKRIAVVRVVNNCSGEFQDFTFTQEGKKCGYAAHTPEIKTTNENICSDDGSIIAYVSNPKADIDYIWTYNGVVIHTGKSIEITRPGEYTVHADLTGCNSQSATITKTTTGMSSPAAPVISASNSGILCGGGNVILTARNVAQGNEVLWIHNGNIHSAGNGKNSLTLKGADMEGEWFAVQKNSNCSSNPSNKVTLIDHTTTGTSLNAPVATVNGTPLESGNITVCNEGSLLLEIGNTAEYASGAVYEWFNNGVSIYKGSNSYVYYANVPKGTDMTLSVQVSDNSGKCPNTIISKPLQVTGSAPTRAVINGNANSAFICSSNPAALSASPSTAGDQNYEWFLDGILIKDANNLSVKGSSYKASKEGLYTVRYKEKDGCWSQLSQAIAVKESLPTNIRWGFADSTANIGNAKVYSVEAVPEPSKYEWTTSSSDFATVKPIGNGNMAEVTFLKEGEVTITVKTPDSGCGVAQIAQKVTIKTNCTPVTSAALTPGSERVVNKVLDQNGVPKTGEDAETIFHVSANNGNKPHTYEWYVNGVLQTGANSEEFIFKTPTKTADGSDITISADFKIKAKVKNCTSNFIETAETKVHVIRDYPLDTKSFYRIEGRICYDIKKSNFDVACGVFDARKDNITQNNISGKERTHEYEFIDYSGYNGLFWEVLDPQGVVEKITTLDNNKKVLITFKPTDQMATIVGTTKVSAYKLKLIAKFLDGKGTATQIELPISIQDCSCGCPLEKNDGKWVTFMCYNLGADPSTHLLTAQQQAELPAGSDEAQKLWGDLYQWGRMADGHQKRNSGTASGQVSSLDHGQVASTSDKYGKFISDNTNWRSPNDTTLWKSTNVIKTYSDPCPLGWRIPTGSELEAITGNDSKNVATKIANHGGKVTPRTGTVAALFLPFSGMRLTDGSLAGANSLGMYWSSSMGTTLIGNLGPKSYHLGTTLTIALGGYGYDYSSASSVRCVSTDSE